MTEILPANTEMLVSVPGVEIDRGVRFHGVLPFEDWLVWAHQTIFVGKMLPWVIGDTLNYGEDMYGEDYAQAIDSLGLAPQTLANYKSICRRIPRDVRRVHTLPITTHDLVAPLPIEEQKAWLLEAETKGFTRDELRQALREAKGIKEPEITPRMLAEQCLEHLRANNVPAAIDSVLLLLSVIR